MNTVGIQEGVDSLMVIMTHELVIVCLLVFNRHSLRYTEDDYKFLLLFPLRGGVQAHSP